MIYVDNELKQYLIAMEARINERITKLNERIEQTETRVNERIERTETNLLTAFHQWASPVDMRARSHTAAIRALDIEVESLANRVTKLDGGPLNSD